MATGWLRRSRTKAEARWPDRCSDLSGGNFGCIEIEFHSLGSPLEGPLWTFGAVNGDLVFVGEMHPVFGIGSEARMRFHIGCHDDEPEFQDFDGPVSELSRFHPSSLGQLLVDATLALALELDRNMSAIRESNDPCSEQGLLGSPREGPPAPRDNQATDANYDCSVHFDMRAARRLPARA
jgi:hypothetical protein